MVRNPVMFVVDVGSLLTTLLLGPGVVRTRRSAGRLHRRRLVVAMVHGVVRQLLGGRGGRARQGPGRSAPPTRRQTQAKQLPKSSTYERLMSAPTGHTPMSSTALRRGDIILVEAGDTVPADGEVVAGIASVDESAVTGKVRR